MSSYVPKRMNKVRVSSAMNLICSSWSIRVIDEPTRRKWCASSKSIARGLRCSIVFCRIRNNRSFVKRRAASVEMLDACSVTSVESWFSAIDRDWANGCWSDLSVCMYGSFQEKTLPPRALMAQPPYAIISGFLLISEAARLSSSFSSRFNRVVFPAPEGPVTMAIRVLDFCWTNSKSRLRLLSKFLCLIVPVKHLGTAEFEASSIKPGFMQFDRKRQRGHSLGERACVV